MKRVLTFIAIAVVALALSGCNGNSDAFSGYVVGKRYTPAHTVRHYNTTIHKYTTRHYPDMWVVFVADSTGVRQLNVRKETFESVQKGDFVTPRMEIWQQEKK